MSKDLPIVSIIIPIFDVEPYIRQCIQSVMDQSVTGGIECILVDDCGQDKSMDIAQKMIDLYEGKVEFRIVHHTHNRGLSAARNTGIKEAKGKWLYFLDSDDWIIPECIELMVGMVRKYPNVDMVQGGACSNHDTLKWLDCSSWQTKEEFSDDPDWIVNIMWQRLSDIPVTAWNKLIRRSFVLQNNLYFVEGMIHEDEMWSFMISQSIQSVALCKVNTYFYLYRPCSIMTNESPQEQEQKFIKIQHDVIRRIDNRHHRFFVSSEKNRINTFFYNAKDRSVEKECAQLNIELARKTKGFLAIKLWLWGFLVNLNDNKNRLLNYLIYALEREDTLSIVLRDVIKRTKIH